jgi:large subunit ribosomal protein L24
LPKYLLALEQDKTPYRTMERGIPLSSVRLVAPLPDPETGHMRDVIVNEIELEATTAKRSRGKERPARFIAGLAPRTSIPYPERREERWPDNECDTLRIRVEERTFEPVMETAPMPESVIDELRNKYSKFRTRHDEDYIMRKRAEDQAAKMKKMEDRQKMMTPLQQLRQKMRREKKARGWPELQPEALAKIGQVMARNRGLVPPTEGVVPS